MDIQAANTFQIRFRFKIALEQKPLRGAAETCRSEELPHSEIIPQAHVFIIKIKISTRADGCIDQKPNIKPQWTTKIGHKLFLHASI